MSKDVLNIVLYAFITVVFRLRIRGDRTVRLEIIAATARFLREFTAYLFFYWNKSLTKVFYKYANHKMNNKHFIFNRTTFQWLSYHPQYLHHVYNKILMMLSFIYRLLQIKYFSWKLIIFFHLIIEGFTVFSYGTEKRIYLLKGYPAIVFPLRYLKGKNLLVIIAYAVVV